MASPLLINGINIIRVKKPINEWDTNFHFITKFGDFLVDLQDVIDWKYMHAEDGQFIDGANTHDAIQYALELSRDDIQWYWTVN